MSAVDYRNAYEQFRITRMMARLLEKGHLPKPSTGQIIGAWVELYLEDVDAAVSRTLGLPPEQLPQ